MFSFNNNAVAATSQPQQQTGNNHFSSSGPFSVNEPNNSQPLGQQQPTMLGQQQQQNYGQPQQQQPPFGQFGHQPQQPGQQLTGQQQQQLVEQQRLQIQQQQQMSYVPGYLSRMRGDKPYRSSTVPLEPGSPDVSREIDSSSAFGTPASKSVKEDISSSRGQPSPTGKFSSSFFDDRNGSAAASWRGARESIFGAGGLRGGRKTMTPAPAPETPGKKAADTSFSPGRSFRAATSPPTRYMDEEDDDAPPQERLEDIKPTGSTYNHRKRENRLSMPATSEPLSGHAAIVDKAKRTILVYGYPHWMEKAVLEIFSAIGPVQSIEAIDITGSGSAQDQVAVNPNGPFLPCCTRIRYDNAFQVLHALRRNGEIVAGACIVGVRWEDENYHQISLTNGVDAVFRKDVHPSSRTADVFKSSSKPLAIPLVDGEGSLNARLRIGPSGSSTLTNTSFPLYGRPISVIIDSASALKPVGSPFRSNSTTSAPTTAPSSDKKSNGVLGRITDGIFGW